MWRRVGEMLNNSKWSRVNIDNLSAQKEGAAHENKLCNKYNYPQCINLFAFDYLIGISRVICLGCVAEVF